MLRRPTERQLGRVRAAAWAASVALLVATAAAQDAARPDAKAARELLQAGKYAEAAEAFDAIAAALKPEDTAGRLAPAIGRADALRATGKLDDAIAGLEAFTVGEKPSADAMALVARIELDRGRWAEAAARADAALRADPDHLLGRFVKAELDEAQGKSDPESWRWFIDHFNLRKGALARDPSAMVLVGQAAERYYRARARGEELAEGLNDVINDLYEGALAADPKCWQAAWLEGRLFLSGYREGDARKELNRALLMNPSAAEVLVTLGQADLQGYKLAEGRRRANDAIEINPACAPAYTLLADLNISDERFADALDAARKAVAANPNDEAALGRVAAACRLLMDPVGAAAAEAAALAINPRPATFYAALGERLADRRKYHSAERAFLQAIAADPERGDTRIGLGMLYMQIGREAEARDLFAQAFAADPFNVRADNMMRVLEHLAAYRPVESPHYRVLVLPDQDELLGKYMSKFLEESHAGLAKRFDFEPPGQTTIEIMKNHQWFSGRTLGLPFIPTVGACTGKVVALASPRATQKPFNWSRVLIHEVTHVITLQQTEFNIPHWFTEALAVESEQTPRPQEWNALPLDRVPQRKRLLNLDTINLGFIRPEQAEDRQMAYCQAQLYAQYMIERFGPDAPAKMLAAYRRGLTTDRAIPNAFGVGKADFEAKYLEFLDRAVKTIRARAENEEPIAFSKLQEQLAAAPDDAKLNARMAYEHFARRDYKEARPFAEAALKADPHQPLASYVKARLLISVGEESTALELLRPAYNPDEPDERLVDLLGELEMKAGRLDEAVALFEAARKRDPYHSKWLVWLSRAYLRQGDRARLLETLGRLAANDSDELAVRQTLAQEYLKRSDFEAAEKWAKECLYIDVYDPAHHAALGRALAGRNEPAGAIEEFEVALSLKPKKPGPILLGLARASRDAGRPDEARKAAAAAAAAEPDNAEAKALVEELGKTAKP